MNHLNRFNIEWEKRRKNLIFFTFSFLSDNLHHLYHVSWNCINLYQFNFSIIFLVFILETIFSSSSFSFLHIKVTFRHLDIYWCKNVSLREKGSTGKKKMNKKVKTKIFSILYLLLFYPSNCWTREAEVSQRTQRTFKLVLTLFQAFFPAMVSTCFC